LFRVTNLNSGQTCQAMINTVSDLIFSSCVAVWYSYSWGVIHKDSG